MRKLLAALAVLTALVPAAAEAQQRPFARPAPPQASPMSPVAWDRHMTYTANARRYDWEAFLANNDQARAYLAQQPLERIDLANRVSGLIQLGKCDEARALANAEGDRNMALRVRQIC